MKTFDLTDQVKPVKQDKIKFQRNPQIYQGTKENSKENSKVVVTLKKSVEVT